jgi:EAL domain-containing protein (putative c-di-GMP-specific phosphodiesterase class I)
MSRLPDHSFAFQPIVNMTTREMISYECLVRGTNGESAHSVLSAVQAEDLYDFDEKLRVGAIRLAAKLGNRFSLNLNFLPGSLEQSHTAISSTINAARECGIQPESLTIEISEGEVIRDIKGFARLIDNERQSGIKLSIDDFGAGYAGLNLLAELQPDSIKLDMQLARGVESRGPRQAIVRGIQRTCLDLGIDVIAEGVETEAEYLWFHSEGIELFQGYLFCKPLFEELPLLVFGPYEDRQIPERRPAS